MMESNCLLKPMSEKMKIHFTFEVIVNSRKRHLENTGQKR